jgi:hypothetical protein
VIYAIRFPYGCFQALGLKPDVWSACIATEKETVFWCGKRAEVAGVRAKMPLGKAISLFPEAIIHEREPYKEAAWISAITETLHTVVPRISYHNSYTWFIQAENDVLTSISCSDFSFCTVGAAFDKTTALLASMKAGEYHRIILDESKRTSFLNNASVSLLSGLGVTDQTIQLLQWSGFGTIAQAAQLSRKQCEAQFGQDGQLLNSIFRPSKLDQEVPWFVPQPQFICSITLSYAEKTMDYIEGAAEHAGLICSKALNGKGFQKICFRWEHEQASFFEKVTKEPVFAPARIRRLFKEQFADQFPGTAFELKLQITLKMLTSNVGPSGDLFLRPGLEYAIRRVQKRFPDRIFSYGLIQHTLFPEQSIHKALRR